MANKQFVVIGLGRFGASVAKTLYSLGNDVLVIDKDEDLIQIYQIVLLMQYKWMQLMKMH